MIERLRVPKNLRIDKLTSRFSVDHIEGFHKDKVYFVLSSINAQMRYLNKKGCYPGEQKPYYVPLSSDILKAVIGNNYKKVIDWMLHAKIIITDGHFIKGKRHMHYRMMRHYLGSPVRWVTVTCKSIKNKQPKTSWVLAPKAINYLAKWLTPEHLTIDVEAAKEVLEYERFKKVANYKGDYPNLRYNAAMVNYNVSMGIVEDITELKNPIAQDDFGYRVHTPVTRVKKILRGHITSHGKPLVQVDIKNSQLLFSLWLLSSDNWRVSSKNHREIRSIFDNTSYNIGYNKNNNTINTITFINSLEKLYGKGLSEHPYCKDVCNGVLYEKVVDALDQIFYFKDSWSFKKKRKKVKKIMLRMLFADPDDDRHQRTVYNNANAPIWECFSQLYPEIAELFTIIKMYDYKNLCMLLQRIEATAMFSKVCLALQKQLPEAPIFTIHDCLVTTVDHVEVVKEIMQKAISDFIGFKASVSEERWSDFCLKLPKRLQPKIAA